MTRQEKNEAIARLLGWYQLNGAWIHPDGYAKPLPDFVSMIPRYFKRAPHRKTRRSK